MLAHDANFRLKGRFRKSDVVDVSLTNGRAYFVEEAAYKSYLEGSGDGDGEVRVLVLIPRFISDLVVQISNCVQFHAINGANTRGARNLASTGVVGVCCGRHEIVRPNGLGDLQKGERYVV